MQLKKTYSANKTANALIALDSITNDPSVIESLEYGLVRAFIDSLNHRIEQNYIFSNAHCGLGEKLFTANEIKNICVNKFDVDISNETAERIAELLNEK